VTIPRDRPLVLVTVGTDHHPFDRLVRWTNDWIVSRAPDVRVLVQTGTATTPSLARGVPMLEHEGMRRFMAEASVVVTHGGTATILEARRHGLVPIVVPRRAAYGEHVDDHQVGFAARLAGEGEARVAENEEAFRALIDDALERPERFRLPPSPESGAEAAARFGRVVEPLLPVSVPRTPVLYIGGMGRSGTTLLERMLGEVAGFTPVGEVVFLWERGLLADEQCGCGLPFSACPFWEEVGRRAYGGWDQVDGREIAELRARVDRQRFVHRMATPWIARSYQIALKTLGGLLQPLYRAMAEVGGGVVVDSSKHASYAFVMRRVPGVSLRVVHMIRDSHGVAHSLAKRVHRPEVTDRVSYMTSWSPVATSVHWAAHNTLLEALAALGVPTTVVRYERLVDSPREELRRVLAFAGRVIDDESLDLIEGQAVRLGPSHTISGNPMRFRHGLVPLRLDDAWKEGMPGRRKAVVTAMTFPWLVRYGYVGRSP
jgi:UDP-N-acetylglucosamine transferase subunit ALG13